jgi:flagella basal body P-ring formation protein FlgA
MRLSPILAVALSVTGTPTHAIQRLSGDEISKIVTQALEAEGLSASVNISSNRTYPGCEQPVLARPKDSGWQSVEISCAAPKWSRIVRTGLSAPILLTSSTPAPLDQSVLVLVEPLRGGTVLDATHLALKPVARTPLGALTGTPSDYVGRVLTATMAADRPLLARHLDYDWMVEENTPVAIAVSMNGANILSTGVALANGQRGDLIEVRNAGSGRVIRAFVAGQNKVIVRPKLN